MSAILFVFAIVCFVLIGVAFVFDVYLGYGDSEKTHGPIYLASFIVLVLVPLVSSMILSVWS